MTPTWPPTLPRKGLALDGSQVRLLRLLIRILESEGDYESAINHIKELLHYEPDNWPLYRHLAYLYFEMAEPNGLPRSSTRSSPKSKCQWQSR